MTNYEFKKVDKTMEIFLDNCHRKQYPAKSIIIKEGDPSTDLYYIIEGSVSVAQQLRLLCCIKYILEEEGAGTRLRIEAHYQPKPFPRNLAAPLFRFGFGRRLPGVLQAIKGAAESQPDPSPDT